MNVGDVGRHVEIDSRVLGQQMREQKDIRLILERQVVQQ